MANYVLEILDGDRAGEVLALADRAIRIGRKPGNDLVLADEKTSGVHAEVVTEGDRHVLRDLGSTNGTFLDGKRVTEIVLTPGDVVTVGRLRVRFRAEGEAPPVDAGDLAVRKLDAGRLQGRGGSVAVLGLVLTAMLGAGGYFWWQGQAASEDGGADAGKRNDPLVVTGNKLPGKLGACETEEGWALRAAGVPFTGSSRGHTGSGALLANRGEAADAADFGVLRLQEALPVLTGRSFVLAAHVKCEQGAQAALRGLAFAANEQVPFQYRTGTRCEGAEGWQRLQCEIAIPAGCDRLQLEVVAVLPTATATVLVDDLAITEAGAATALELKAPDSGPTALGTGAALAVRSVDTNNPVVLLEVLPGSVPAALQGLHKAGLCVLSDVGATLACKATDAGLQLAATGSDGLQLVLPSEAASGLLVAAESTFASASADGEFTASSLLLGDRLTRTWLRMPASGACRGATAGARYRLTLPATTVDLVFSFGNERRVAAGLLRQARDSRQQGKPGAAMEQLRSIEQQSPMDSEVLAEAFALRRELLAAQADRQQRLERDLEEASFFTTRGGFERVVLGVESLIADFGDDNLEQRAAVGELRDKARAQLAAIDDAQRGSQRERLTQLATAFDEAQQAGLGKLVRQYVEKHLPSGSK